jgi:GTP-binding protein HflX
VDGADVHAREHRVTVQAVLTELGAGDKPRVVALNKADRYDAAAAPELPAPILGPLVPVSALTGYGLDTLRLRLGSAMAGLWELIDVRVPYAEGELLSRVRERGTVEVDYGDHDVHVSGRVVPSLAGELRAAAARYQPLPEAAAP